MAKAKKKPRTKAKKAPVRKKVSKKAPEQAPTQPVAAATAPKKSERKILRPDVEIFDERLVMNRECLAVAFDVTRDTVSKWRVDPVWKEGKEVFFYLPEIVHWRFGFDGGRLDPGQEKALLDKTRREQAELELKKKRGDLFEIQPLLKEWERVLTGVRQKLYSIPVKIAKPFSMINNPQAIKAELEEKINETLADAEDFVEMLREKNSEAEKRKRVREAVRRHRANSRDDSEDTEAPTEA